MAQALSQPLRVAAEVVLRPYGQVLLSRDLRTGLLVLFAVATFPKLLAATLLALVVSASAALLFGLGLAGVREGTPTCTAVLTALGIAVFAPGGGHPLVLVVIGALLATLLTASFEAVFASVTLPTHSFPFVFATWGTHLAARSLPADTSGLVLVEPAPWLQGLTTAGSWLDVPAALLFVHGAAAGLLIIAAVFVHSRIALVLGFIGGAVAMLLGGWLRPAGPSSAVDLAAAFNAVLAAMALGGVWFVPQPSSLLLAAGGAAMTVVLTYALSPLTGLAFLPVLSLPFVLGTHLVLMAARRRMEDRRPRSALPAERPEEALAHHFIRRRRFGDAAWLPFRLPFRGQWLVTQGHDGAHTHQGLWRHGLDFEGVGPDGKTFRGDGASLRDYHAYGLPVVAAGTGTVVRVVDGIEDNVPGQVNTDDRWGNAVIVAHGPTLYSVYAHLKPGSITVRQGELVAAGAELGRCGSSGRSPVPHLHFQVQRSAVLGAPTLSVSFGDVVTEKEGQTELSNLIVPAEGDVVRPVLRDEPIARVLAFAPGTAYELVHEGGRSEVARVELGLLGQRMLRSDRATLFVEPYESGFVVVDFHGDPRSLLRFVLVGLARVPFDQGRALRWRDSLPGRLLLPGWIRPVADLVALVAPELRANTVDYRADRQPGSLTIEGTSARWSTKTLLSLGKGEHRIELRRGASVETVVLRKLEPGEEPKATKPLSRGFGSKRAPRAAPGTTAKRMAVALGSLALASLSTGALAEPVPAHAAPIAQEGPPPPSLPTDAQLAARAGAWDRSVALERQGDLERARALLLQAWGTDSPSYEVTVRVAWLSLRLAELDLAQYAYQRAATLAGAGPEAREGLASTHLARANAALDAGDDAAARESLEQALALDPARDEVRVRLDETRELRFEPSIWLSFLGLDVAGRDAYGGALLVELPLRVTDDFALRGAYRHTEASESKPASAPDQPSPRGPGGSGGGGASRKRFYQEEAFLGFGAGLPWLWFEALGLLVAPSSERVAGGEAARLRLGHRWGAQVEQSLVARSQGLNGQISPTAFVWPTGWLGFGAGARITIDEIGTEPSALLGVSIMPGTVALHLSGHYGIERWPVVMTEPTVLSLDQELTGGGSLTALFELDPSWQLGLSGRLERIEQEESGGLYGNAAVGLVWSPVR